jgi:hypothetical protein
MRRDSETMRWTGWPRPTIGPENFDWTWELLMKAFRTCLIALVAAVALGVIAGAEEKHSGNGGARRAGFERIKALNGDWEVSHGPHEHGAPGGTASYRVTAGGSAVLETLFGGSEHEMVTLYYMEGDDLTLTHYCMLQNRPRMRAELRPSGDQIIFKCREGENAAIEAEDHMHQVTFTFIDANHLKTEWVLYKGGKRDSIHSFDLARKRK